MAGYSNHYNGPGQRAEHNPFRMPTDAYIAPTYGGPQSEPRHQGRGTPISGSGGYGGGGAFMGDTGGGYQATSVPTLDEYTREQQARAARSNSMKAYEIAGNEAFRSGGAGGAARQAFSRAQGATEGQRAYDDSMFDTARLNIDAMSRNQTANLSAAQLRQNAYQFGAGNQYENDRFLLSLLGGFG